MDYCFRHIPHQAHTIHGLAVFALLPMQTCLRQKSRKHKEKYVNQLLLRNITAKDYHVVFRPF